jgi:hypothetical protein
MTWYETVHDFAAPIATICAACAAVFVTWRVGTRQVEIARQQADTARQQAAIATQQANTALDRLRYDLFDKRYSIYLSAQRIIELTLQEQIGYEDARKLNQAYVAIGEAPFFFPVHICEFLNQLGNDCKTHRRVSKNDAVSDEVVRLLAIRDSLPIMFSKVLAFSQLTGNQDSIAEDNAGVDITRTIVDEPGRDVAGSRCRRDVGR